MNFGRSKANAQAYSDQVNDAIIGSSADRLQSVFNHEDAELGVDYAALMAAGIAPALMGEALAAYAPELELGDTLLSRIGVGVAGSLVGDGSAQLVKMGAYSLSDGWVGQASFSWGELAVSGLLGVGGVLFSEVAGVTIGRLAGGGGGVPNETTTLTYQPTSGVLLQAQEGQTTTILGSYANDIKSVIGELGNVKSTDFGPNPGGFNVLNVPDSLYVPQQFWSDYNQPWLSNAIGRGDNFLMATPPTFDTLDVNTGISVLTRPNPITGQMELSGFGREYLMMRQAGYSYQNGVMTK